ncbi:MAG: VWA domain-containing protein [Anaerolineaceae bacterium]|nr:VWA domain-containing protein [Anaerolineaceae bacterium]
MSLLTPLALLGALLAIPIILLYMLRLRRREVLVSSTFLWRQVVLDNEANTPWQRLRRNILLLLQLVILALLVFALARPFITVPAVSAGQVELLLDASASMNATDINGQSRFTQAKREALNILDTLGSDDAMTVIRVGDVPEVIAPATNDRSVLRRAINDAQPGNAGADWTAALTLAVADAVNSTGLDIVIIGDGGLGDAENLPGVPNPENVRYVPVGVSSSNLAITALATRALPGQQPELFAQITNYGTQDASVIFDLRVDGDLLAAQRHVIPAGQDFSLVSTQLPDNFTVLQAGLTTTSDSTVPDYLASDNTAWTVSSEVGTRRVLVMSPGNLFLSQVMRSLPAIEAFAGNITSGLPSGNFDLYLLDGWLPDGDLPEGDILIINPPRSTDLFTVGTKHEMRSTPVVASNDPRMAFVDFSGVNILGYVPVSETPWADTLISVDNEPLLLAGEVDGRQVAILTFDLHESDLPLQIAWPVLMANLLDWFTPRSAISAPNGLSVGESLAIRPPFEATAVRVTLPDGSQRDLLIDRDVIVFGETHLPGLYTVDILQGDTLLESAPFTVNLFALNESDITPRSEIRLSGATIAATGREEVGQREIWPWVVLAALLVLLIEWYVYHQRLSVRTLLRPVLLRQRTA